MNNKKFISKYFFLLFILCFSCGTPEADLPSSTNISAQIITIIEMNFIPLTLSANPGESIVIYNQDSISHRLLSQSANNQFDDTQDIDSDIISPGQSAIITLPEDVVAGDFLFFYDGVLSNLMITPNGVIEIE